MNSKEFASRVKAKYPEYQSMDDDELTRRIVAKYPEYQSQIDPDWKGVIGSAMNNAVMGKGSYTRKLMTDPETQANAVPSLMGTVGGLSPLPGGATIGTGSGQFLRDLMLKTLNKPVPGVLQHGLELGGAAIGDLMAIPAMKAAHYGKEIGKAEKAAGVVTRAPTKAVTPGSVGQTLNDLEAQIDAGTIRTAQEAKDAKAVISQIFKNRKIYEQTPEINVQSARVSQKVQNLLNEAIKGRKGPSDAMGKALTIPRAIRNSWESLPWAVKRGAQGAAGVLGVEELVRALRGR